MGLLHCKLHKINDAKNDTAVTIIYIRMFFKPNYVILDLRMDEFCLV